MSFFGARRSFLRLKLTQPSSHLPLVVVTFVWATLVYDPVACWTWNSTGWGFIHGELDFAGGGPVHMTSGTASLIWSFYLGKRRGEYYYHVSVAPSLTSVS